MEIKSTVKNADIDKMSINKKNLDLKKRWREKRLTMGRKGRREKKRQTYRLESWNILIFLKWHGIFLPFNIISHLAFIIFDIISSRHFFTISHFVRFGVYYIGNFFQSTFFTFRHFVPFDIYYLRSYVLSSLFTIRRFFLSTFFTIVFYRQRFLLQHFVGESNIFISYLQCIAVR